jgi:hypothetical protein
MPAYKNKTSGQVVQAMPIFQIMRVAQTTPLALPQWVLAAYKDGRMSFSLEAAFIRQNLDKSDEPVKYRNDYWLVETSPNKLEGFSQAEFTSLFEMLP